MGRFNDWLNGKNYDPKKDNGIEYYEDTHDENGKYTGRSEPKILPNDKTFVAGRRYQNVVVYAPSTREDVQYLIDFLKRREPAIVNLDGIEEVEVSQRILDFVSGAIYALNGSIHRITTNIFLLSPEGVEITIPYDI